MSKFKLRSRQHLHNPASKRAFNRELFSAIAAEYSSMSGILSFGRDRPWKRAMIAELPELKRPRCLDLACGNGDLIQYLLDRYPGAQVVGLDLTPPMLDIARKRFSGRAEVELVEGDMTQTGLAAEGFDIITVGYGIRNAPTLDGALAEIARLLKPGGTAAVLDFSRWNRLDRVELAALRVWGGLWGLIRSGNPDTYGYIADSLARYPRRSELHSIFEDCGLRIQSARRRFCGVVEAVIATKEMEVDSAMS